MAAASGLTLVPQDKRNPMLTTTYGVGDMILDAVAGSIGAWCGMMLFRHKTKHWKFKIGVPLIFFLQLALIVYVYWKYQQ